ncbi:serine protease [Rosistilla oblonga]|uniref:serine protease n=1 Tax=Rosistilla oblonga TaxID=2527990 RepID=UPI003A98672E
MLKKFAIASALIAVVASTSMAQSVCLPAPRLLTTMPMGGQVGSEFDVAITGQTIENTEQLLFSSPKITATPKLDASGKPVANQFVVSIAADCPPGIHTARVMSRLGISSARVFTVSDLPEVTQTKPSASVETAMPIEINSVCNATLPVRAANHYSFSAKKGQRLVVDCAAPGIDSKMNPVLILADAQGRDMLVERRGGALDYTVPADGDYMVKVHDLTFKGGAECFYRLAVQEVPADAPLARLPSTRAVGSFSWPPTGLAAEASASETEPNNDRETVQAITLPCDIAGSFFPAADVDAFEFTAKMGEVWWVEVASERLGRPTDASIIVQQVIGEGADEKLVDLVELADIASPIKRSSNAYAYDGPPYNAGSTDILGKMEIKEDGKYRLQITDLFGGTRNDPNNVYRLVIRQAEPDFAVVAWPLHMVLRNGDRNALSKPLALRGGSTVALEVVAVRRDGFNGEIELTLENLPDGVTTAGLKIPAGKARGLMLVTAHQDAPRGLTMAKFTATATIGDKPVTHPCHVASVAWPVTNAWSEIPAPRLLADIPVSVGGSEFAAITIAPTEEKVWEAKAGETLKIPLQHVRRGEFSGTLLGLRTMGAGFEGVPKFDLKLNEDASEAVLDLAKLKTPPGDYTIAFYGSAVAKHRDNPDRLVAAEAAHAQAQQTVTDLTAEVTRLANETATASPDQKADSQKLADAVAEQKKAADAALAAAAAELAKAKKSTQPKDIADIVISQPISIRVSPGESK